MENIAGCSSTPSTTPSTLSTLSTPSTPSSPPSGPVVGIDLGTTYSAVAVYRRGKVEIFSNESGSRTTPSVAGFLSGESFVGEAAQDLPANCQVFDAKRLIGRPFNAILTSEITHWPFMVIEKKGVPVVRVTVNESKKEDFFPEEISAMVLRNLKETAEASLQETVSRAVITVPAFFNERQRQMTKLAGKIAGLDVVGMINEPTAAAVAYGLDKSKGSDGAKKTLFIYDLGGGTFDVSVMTVSGREFTVLASGGDTHLGGEDFDSRLLHALIEDVRTQHDVCLDSVSVHELRRACELAKRKLSALSEVPVSVYFPRHNLNYKTSVTRARFENLCSDLFNKTLTIAVDVLANAKVTKDAVDEVVLVGGSTRIPKVRAILRDFFDGKEPRRSINPDEAVAYGAAVHAAALEAGDDLSCNMVKLKDVTPLSLGILTRGGGFCPVVARNTPIPCKVMKTFTKCRDAKATSFAVYQGERQLAKDNHYLNKKFSIPTPLPQKDVKIDCCFTIDADGLLTVTAKDMVTGATGQVTVTQEEGALSEDAVKDMIERAQRFRVQDTQDLLRVQESQQNEERAQQNTRVRRRALKRKIRR